MQSPPKVRAYLPYSALPLALGGAHQHVILNLFANARRRYGDIYCLDLGFKQAVILAHPRYAHHILRNQAAHYPKGGALMTPLRSISGTGVTTASGQVWREQRQAIQPFFQRSHVTAQIDAIWSSLEQNFTSLRPHSVAETPVNMSTFFALLTTQLTATNLLNSPLSVAQSQQLNHAIHRLNQQALYGVLVPMAPAWLPLPGRQRHQEAARQIHQVIDALIDAAPQRKQNTDTLFATLLARAQSLVDPQQARQQLHDEVLALLIAGYDTTATGLVWACYLLSQHPAALRRVHQEIDQVIGDRQPTATDLTALPYLSAVITETLRLYPPSWRLARVAGEADCIDGFGIEAGQSILTLVYLIQRHPAFWVEPERFLPERFVTQGGASPDLTAWFPFGLGSRKCVGQELALLEMKLILIALLQRYHLTPSTTRHPGIQLAMTLKPRRDLWLRLTARAAVA